MNTMKDFAIIVGIGLLGIVAMLLWDYFSHTYFYQGDKMDDQDYVNRYCDRLVARATYQPQTATRLYRYFRSDRETFNAALNTLLLSGELLSEPDIHGRMWYYLPTEGE